MKKKIFILIIFMSLISCSELGKMRKEIYLTEEEKKELIEETERIDDEHKRKLETERINKLTESVEKRFQNDIKKYDNFELIDSYDFIALKTCLLSSYSSSRRFVNRYGQFDYYIRSKDVYKNDKEFMELFEYYLHTQDKYYPWTSFDEEYELLKEELYYLRIGKMGRSFTYSEEREYSSLRTILNYSNTDYNYYKLVNFLKNWDDNFRTREKDEQRKNDLFEKYN